MPEIPNTATAGLRQSGVATTQPLPRAAIFFPFPSCTALSGSYIPDVDKAVVAV